MSFKMTSLAWEASKTCGSDRLVLLALADTASHDGEAWPAVSTLAEQCGVSVRTVQYSLRRLVELGELEVEPRVHPKGDPTSNLYRIMLGRERKSGHPRP